MSDQLLSRSGYVYCVRRSGKTHYRLGSAPAGQLVDRLKKLTQTEENPTTLVLVGWIEVQDYALAARTLRETFHLYRLQDHWFDFRVSRASELKSLLGAYADLMVNLPVAEPLMIHEPQPQYDRSFGFFEAVDAVNHCTYFPPDSSGIPVFPLPEKLASRWSHRLGVMAFGVMGVAAVAIALSSIYGIQASQSPPATTNPLPSSKPSPAPSPKPNPPKNNISPPPQTPIAVPNRPQSTIWSDSSEGARLRSNPDDAGDDIDFLPNGTPITLGETSGAWQEIILTDGRRGWVFNDLIPD